MTKSYIINNSINKNFYNNWDEGIIAPKFNLKSLIDELHYYSRIYILQRKSFLITIKFLFLNAIQRIFYTLGTFLTSHSTKINKNINSEMV